MLLYKFLDLFFVVFHTVLIIFNLFGWIWHKTRLLNLITLLLTAASRFILGIFYGMGYCFMTDWHWQVLHELGVYDLPNSYISYLVERITGTLPNQDLVDILTLAGLFLALGISVYLNIFRPKTGAGRK